MSGVGQVWELVEEKAEAGAVEMDPEEEAEEKTDPDPAVGTHLRLP